MPTLTEIERFRRANLGILSLVERDLDSFWQTLDLSRPDVARDALLEFVPTLTTLYGEPAALIAADWYDELRAAEGVPGRFRATMAAPFPAEYVQQRVRYGAGHLFTDAPDQTLQFLRTAVSEYVLQPGRDTVQRSAVQDPRASGWHRETRPTASYPSGCGFCRLLAGRGGVYKWDAAPFAAHGGCMCVAVPSWDPNAEEVPAIAYSASVRKANMSDEQRAQNSAQLRAYINAYFPDD